MSTQIRDIRNSDIIVGFLGTTKFDWVVKKSGLS
tara:strand:- start:83 stop:184 length:102 start_codon:yes stop_codon:yes gene_type:complete